MLCWGYMAIWGIVGEIEGYSVIVHRNDGQEDGNYYGRKNMSNLPQNMEIPESTL